MEINSSAVPSIDVFQRFVILVRCLIWMNASLASYLLRIAFFPLLFFDTFYFITLLCAVCVLFSSFICFTLLMVSFCLVHSNQFVTWNEYLCFLFCLVFHLFIRKFVGVFSLSSYVAYFFFFCLFFLCSLRNYFECPVRTCASWFSFSLGRFVMKMQ